MLNGPVIQATAGVENIRLDEGAGRTGVQATSAILAWIGFVRLRINGPIFRRKQSREEKR